MRRVLEYLVSESVGVAVLNRFRVSDCHRAGLAAVGFVGDPGIAVFFVNLVVFDGITAVEILAAFL